MDRSDDRLTRYCRSDYKKINGWLHQLDAELFLHILQLQSRSGIVGATAEIGVHHGKSFVPLCLALKGAEKALCIDIFEDQALNKDRSGFGSRQILEKNLARFEAPMEKVSILAASSFDVTAAQIRNLVGEVRFFSVDGGHWRDIVVNDLNLAAAVLHEGGVIALDDFLHKEWPDVTHGFFDWYAAGGADFGPIAISEGKLYLAHRKTQQMYLDSIYANEALNTRVWKTYEFLDTKVPILITRYPAFVVRLKRKLERDHPNLLERIKEFRRRG